jgi:hypothetical protein
MSEHLWCLWDNSKVKVKVPRNIPEGIGGRGIALLFLYLSARRGWVVSTTPRPLYPRERPVSFVQEAGWAPVPVWTCAKNLVSTGIRSPDRLAGSQLLYRPSYSGPPSAIPFVNWFCILTGNRDSSVGIVTVVLGWTTGIALLV